MQDSETPGHILEAFTLLGILANYNKFEFQNPYQIRFNYFVNEATIQKIIHCVGYTCQALRLDYIDVQDDIPEGWTLSNTLHLIGLGLIAGGPKPEKKPVYDAETAKQLFSNLYVFFCGLPRASCMLTLTIDLVKMQPFYWPHMILPMSISCSALILCRYVVSRAMNGLLQATYL